MASVRERIAAVLDQVSRGRLDGNDIEAPVDMLKIMMGNYRGTGGMCSRGSAMVHYTLAVNESNHNSKSCVPGIARPE